MKLQQRIKKWIMISIAAAVFSSAAAYAKDVWEERDGVWYYYEESDSITDPESYEKKPFTGWVQDEGSRGWYYIENSKMMTGWVIIDGKFYFFKEDGSMAWDEWVGNFYLQEDGSAQIGGKTPDGTKLSDYGSKMRGKTGVEELNWKTAQYIEVLREYPDAKVEFGAPGDVVQEPGNGKRFLIFKAMTLYDRKTGARLYKGDGAFELNAKIEVKVGDSVIEIKPEDMMEYNSFMAERAFISPAGLITRISQEPLQTAQVEG